MKIKNIVSLILVFTMLMAVSASSFANSNSFNIQGTEVHFLKDQLTQKNGYTLREVVIQSGDIQTFINTKIFKDGSTETIIKEQGKTYNVNVDKEKNIVQVNDKVYGDFFSYSNPNTMATRSSSQWKYLESYDSSCEIGVVLMGATIGVVVGELIALFPWISNAYAEAWAGNLIGGAVALKTMTTAIFVHTEEYYNVNDSDLRRGEHDFYFDEDHKHLSHSGTSSWLVDFAD